MNTTVITFDQIDYGAGPSDRVTFVDSKYVVDTDDGTLHVYRGDGNVGSFPHGSWRAVVRGEVVSEAGTMEVKKPGGRR